MSEQDKPAEAAVEQITSVHILGAVSHTLSTDGTAAMIVFEVADVSAPGGRRRFGVTLPTNRIEWLLSVVSALKRHAQNAKQNAGSFAVHQGIDWSIGSSPEHPKVTSLIFNKEMSDCYAIAFPNVVICQLAGAIMRDVTPRMSMAERNEARLLPKLLAPDKSIIVPPGK